MTSRLHKELTLMFRPFQFILKEGQGIEENFFDYSLLMLQIGCPEIIRSPVPTSEEKSTEEEITVIMQMGRIQR